MEILYIRTLSFKGKKKNPCSFLLNICISFYSHIAIPSSTKSQMMMRKEEIHLPLSMNLFIYFPHLIEIYSN